MVWRRQSSVVRARQLLNAIAYTRQQKQISNLERIGRYMKRNHKVSSSETQRQLECAVQDNLVISYTAVGTKGSKTGTEQEGFKIMEEAEIVDDGHDWYCFECHGPGDVVMCDGCWRVFHEMCCDEQNGFVDGEKFFCYICKDIEAGRKRNRIKGKLLNTLLGYTVHRLKEKTRELHRIGHREEEISLKRFVYRAMDLNTMEQFVQDRRYRCMEELVADAHNIVHNVFLMYGEEHGMTELAIIMIKDCKYDIEEIRQCWNCYYMSNSKPSNWFCQPCNPPHKLVYAKLKGFSYWPAKVIRISEDEKYDVRFFGGYHQRAVIPVEYIKPISINIKSVTTKRTQGFIKACEELKIHRQLLDEQGEPSKSHTFESETDNNSEEEEEEEREEEAEVEQQPDEEKEEEDDDDDDEEEEDDVELREVTSTSVVPPKHTSKMKTKVSNPENVNVVSSSVDKIFSPSPMAKVVYKHTASQAFPNTTNKSVQTDTKGCRCEEEFKSMFSQYEEKMVIDHKKAIDLALKELAESLQKDFEDDKQQAVARALSNMQREIERARRQTSECCKEQCMEEMKKLSQKHKENTSYIKKKQWCFYCEEEAMYHCCWNTSYCSVQCQQAHWHKGHKSVCRRQRR